MEDHDSSVTSGSAWIGEMFVYDLEAKLRKLMLEEISDLFSSAQVSGQGK